MRKQEAHYLVLYEKLKNDIISGLYAYGSRLPGKRVLAERHGYSLSTVVHALELLEEEGYIEAFERSGCVVSYRSEDFLSTGAKDEREPEAASIRNQNQESFPASVIARTTRRILSERLDEILCKSEGKGLLSLRQALCRYLARARDIHVQPEQVIIGSGSEYLYSLIVQLLGRDKVYGIESPSYEKIAAMYHANGVIIDPLRMGPRGILSEELERTKAKVLHITPYHSYPSGVTADAGKRSEYIKWALQQEAMLVEDDYDSEYTISSKPEDTLFSLEPRHTVIYLNTFTRTISPGIRVSYMLLPQDMVEQFAQKAGFYASTVSTLSQLLIEELLNSGEFERHINRVRRMRRKQRKESHQEAKGLAMP